MSITFTLITETSPRHFGPACTADHGVCTVPEHLLDEDIHLYSREGWCVECYGTNEEACALCNLQVNMSNANAMQAIERLGIEFDYCGHIDPDDLLGRAMVANIGRDDSGVSTTTERTPGNAVLIQVGLPAGYFDSRMAELVALAEAAKTHGCLVGWA